VKVSTSNPNLSQLNETVTRPQGGTTTGSAQGAGAAATQSAATAGDASVSLSGLSQHLQGLAASGSADIDVAHVAAIKAAIKDGSLKIDSGKIADGIIETARNLLQGKQSTGN
jgi:negative regulator of flagellin synthesis FlgM